MRKCCEKTNVSSRLASSRSSFTTDGYRPIVPRFRKTLRAVSRVLEELIFHRENWINLVLEDLKAS